MAEATRSLSIKQTFENYATLDDLGAFVQQAMRDGIPGTAEVVARTGSRMRIKWLEAKS